MEILCLKANRESLSHGLDIMIFMEPLRTLLAVHPVFSSIGEAEQDQLVEQSIRRELQKGGTLAMQGEVWPYLFLVADGGIDAVKVSSEGRNLLITTFGPGELFWGLAFFQEEAPLLVTLEARCPSLIYLWPRQFIEPVFMRNGRLSWELCRVMIQRMQRASTIVEELAFQPVAGRLARLLLDHFKNAGDETISRQLTLDEMAARIGTTREMVCRVLYRFADKNLIDVKRTEFLLTDKAGLNRMAENS
jgi:CRP/FNR family cyclic AMP-dependent transcriptional regulator